MKLRTPLLVVALTATFCLLSAPVFAQQNTVNIELSGTRMRAPLDVVEGKTILQLCQLIPGEQYTVIAAGAAYGQQSAFELTISGSPAKEAENIPGRKHAIRFRAPAACVDLQLIAVTMQPLTTIPMFLSIKCETCPEDKSWLEKFTSQVEMANLSVASGVSAQSLVTNTLIGGDCFEVTNITSSGNPSSRGTFTNGATNIGIQKGMVMGTGTVSILPGPNDSDNAGGGFGINSPNDPDLAAITPGDQFDLSTIEFDFIPTASMIQFDFVFGSEEYCEYVNSEFNDVFGFFISGPGITGNKNIALISGTNTPVTTNNVNHLTNNAYYINNNNYFNFPPSCFLLPAAAPNECELDGWTTVFTAVAEVIPCSTYHIKLAIADITDGLWASAVFLRANSFNAGGAISVAVEYPHGQSAALEGCDTTFLRFTRGNSDTTQALTIDFVVDSNSTATAGVDYGALSSPIVIPAGQSEVVLPVFVFNDNLTEGQESIILLLDESCSCVQSEFTIWLDDRPLEVDLADIAICDGATTILSPVVTGLSPLSYLWSTGDTSSTIEISISNSTVYTVTVTDACGEMAVDSALVSVNPLVIQFQELGLCAGDSIVIEGITYSSDTILIDIFPGLAGECDTVRTIQLIVSPEQTLADTIVFCAGDSILIGGIAYYSSGTVLDTLPGLAGDCDTLVNYTLQMLELPTRSATVELCPGESVSIGGQNYSSAGTVVDRVPGLSGSCDTLVTYTISILPQPTRAETILFCPGDTVQIGGSPYTLPGLVMDTVAAAVGCDTIISYTLKYQTPAPSTVVIDCPFDYEVTINGSDPAIVQFDLPTYGSDCICPGVSLEQTSGLVTGSNFPVGITEVCFVAKDSCGNSASCCFDVRIAESDPCDLKVIGCMKYELLTITKNLAGDKTYRIRVTNNCDREMIYVAFELPPGITAVKPPNNSIYTSPAGREYAVRNPNFSPFYSIRFSSKVNGLANGASDVFAFTLPAQSSPTYIHCIAKVATQSYYEAYLNTFFCPIGIEPLTDPGATERIAKNSEQPAPVQVFPNPTDGKLYLDLSSWKSESIRGRVLNSRGQLVQELRMNAGGAVQEIQLTRTLAEGLYFLELQAGDGTRQVTRFVLQF